MADLLLENVEHLPQLYPGIVSASQLETAGYSLKRTLKGIEFSNGDTTFTASMHSAGLYILDTAPPAHKDTPRMPFQQVLLSGTLLFALALHSAPLFPRTQSKVFIPVVLMIRLLIFLPLPLSYATPSSAFLGSKYWPSRAQHAAHKSYVVLVISLILEATRLASLARHETPSALSTVLKSIHDDPSISALGYDLILAWLSAVAWYMEESTVLGAVDAGQHAILQAFEVVQTTLWA